MSILGSRTIWSCYGPRAGRRSGVDWTPVLNCVLFVWASLSRLSRLCLHGQLAEVAQHGCQQGLLIRVAYLYARDISASSRNDSSFLSCGQHFDESGAAGTVGAGRGR